MRESADISEVVGLNSARLCSTRRLGAPAHALPMRMAAPVSGAIDTQEIFC